MGHTPNFLHHLLPQTTINSSSSNTIAMSEVELKQSEDYVIGGKPQPSMLKKLTSASSWSSPFRSSASKKNVYQEFKDLNSVSQVKVPKKFALHPTLDAQKREKELAEKKEKERLRKEKKAKEAEEKKQKEEQAAKEAEDEAEGAVDLEEAEKEELANDLSEDIHAAAEEDTAVVDEAKIEPLAPETSKKATEAEPETEEKAAEEETEKTEKETEGAAPEAAVADAKIEPLAPESFNKETTAKDAAVKHSEEAKESEEAADKEHSAVKELMAEELAEGTTEGDDDIVEKVKENPIEVDVPNGAKYESVELPNQEVLDKLKDKPVLLNKYQQLNADAIGSVAKSLDDPNKIVDLGSGLRLTQAQLLEIASKRVAPVIATINEEVNKSKKEDDINRQKEYDGKVSKHQGKLDKDFGKHQEKVGKVRATFDSQIEQKLQGLENQIQAAHTEAERFEKQTHEEIETAKTDFQEREEKAVEQHETDKETLIKNHEELTETKKQELEESKTNQETTATEIEELKEKKADLEEKNPELAKKLEELTEKLNERSSALDDLKEKHTGQLAIISQHDDTKADLNKKIEDSNKELDDKRARHATLAGELGILGGVLAAHTLKLNELKDDKKSRTKRLGDAKQETAKWEQEKRAMAEKTHREHEQQRLEAKEAAETERYKKELEEEKKKADEERRIQQEKQEEEQRLLNEEKEKLEEERKRVEEEQSNANASAAAAAAASGSAAGQATAAGNKAAGSKAAVTSENATPKHDTGVNSSIVPQNKEVSTSGQPLPSKEEEKPEKEEKKSKGGLLAGGALGALGGGAAGAAVGSSSKSDGKTFGSSAPNLGGSKEASTSKDAEDASRPKVKKLGSTKRRLKTLFGGNKEAETGETSKALTGGASGGAVTGEAASQQHSKGFLNQDSGADVSSAASTDLYSVYEEVSDEEFERNKGNPRYLEVEEDEALKLLQKNKELIQ